MNGLFLDDLLGEDPLMPTPENARRAASILEKSLPKETSSKNIESVHATTPTRKKAYKKFDPLNQRLSTNFNQPEFSNPIELVEKIDEYFQEVEHEDYAQRIEPSMASFAMHLNVSRKMLNSLEEKPIYGPILSAAKTRIESYLASRLVDGRPSTAGVALVLKNDFDWKEKQEVSGELTFSVTRQMFSGPNEVEGAPETEETAAIEHLNPQPTEQDA